MSQKFIKTSKKYKNSLPRSCVSLPMSSQFQESIAMDLKQFEYCIMLHNLTYIDPCTPVSSNFHT